MALTEEQRERKNAQRRAKYAACADVRARNTAAVDAWRKKRPEVVAEYYARSKARMADLPAEEREAVMERRRQYQRNRCKLPEVKKARNTALAARRAGSPSERVASNCRARLRQALRAVGAPKNERTFALMGCTVAELVRHLESQFLPGMTWDNYSRFGWHVDHIKPVHTFNLRDPEEVSKCFHWTNLRPLWWIDNLRRVHVERKQREQVQAA